MMRSAELIGRSSVSVTPDHCVLPQPSPATAGAPAAPGRIAEFASGLAAGAIGRHLQRHGLSFRPIPQSVPPRRNLYVRGEVCDHTYLLCEGWACRVARLANGRRQILSIVLPGDLFSPTSMFARTLDFHVEAITETRYASIASAELRAKLAQDPQLFESFMALWVAEGDHMNARLINLGQRLAEERIALLILHLMARLESRGFVHDGSMPFPLRQMQVADAVGITPVHVNRVMRALRNAGVIEASKGSLRVLDMAELRRLGGLR